MRANINVVFGAAGLATLLEGWEHNKPRGAGNEAGDAERETLAITCEVDGDWMPWILCVSRRSWRV